MDSIKDVEVANNTPLLDHYQQQQTLTSKNKWKGLLIFSGVLVVLVLCISVGLVFNYNYRSDENNVQYPINLESEEVKPEVLVVEESDEDKEFRLFHDPGALSPSSYQWTNLMLSSQKTGFHFRPYRYWQSDPSGPMYYKGWYHFFYQHNPDAAVWGNIVWGHAVSRDLINWFYLPNAMVPDHWYDIGGVFTGAATILPDGSIVMLYTGATKDKVQIINQAYPADLSDPLLINWVKYSGNPILVQPPGIGLTEFRDPSTAWLTPSGTWRFTIGTKNNHTGISLMYETKDFKNYTLLDERLHEVPHTGMWECVDLYPVSVTTMNGLDNSVNGPQVKHVLKASIDEQQRDYYAVGSYDIKKDVWIPDDPDVDVGIELRYDYGKFYASRTFYDPKKQRRVLWGFSRETDSEDADRKKGWACLQIVPREITLDNKTNANVLQWPVKEIESLRSNKKEFSKVKVEAGSVVPLDVGKSTQLDITAEFEIDKNALEGLEGGHIRYNCTTSHGASARSALGPFGLLVLANDDRSEQTAVYFYIAKGIDGNLKTFFCTDQSRSTKATDVRKENYGSTVRVLDNEKFSVRILIDHSIVEAFAQGGRTVITSRIYPTEAIEGAARVFLFNNATGMGVTATSVKIWEMGSASLNFYPGLEKA